MMGLAIELTNLDITEYTNTLYFDNEGELEGDISFTVNKDDLRGTIKDELDNNEDLLLGYKLTITGPKEVSVQFSNLKDAYIDIDVRVDEIQHIGDKIILIMEIL